MKTLLTGRVMRHRMSWAFSILMAIALLCAIAAVFGLIFIFMLMDIEPNMNGLIFTVCILAGCFVIFFLLAYRVKSGSEFMFTVVCKSDNTLEVVVMDPQERKVISEPFSFDYFFFKKYTDTESLYVTQLVVRIIKDNKLHLKLEDAYGSFYDPPALWPEWGPNPVPYFPLEPAHKTISYVAVGFKSKLAERLVDVLEKRHKGFN